MNKIAIPSNDKISIAEDFESAVFFLVFEVGDGFVSNEELRENLYSPLKENHIDELLKIENLFNFLCDCQIIICRNINKSLGEKFKSVGIKLYKTLEVNARRGIVNTICR